MKAPSTGNASTTEACAPPRTRLDGIAATAEFSRFPILDPPILGA